MKEVKIGKVRFSEKHLGIIAGPCVIEDRDHALKMAVEIKKIADKIDLPIIFKSSFDKANRTSIKSFRGPGIEKGMKIRKESPDKIGDLWGISALDEDFQIVNRYIMYLKFGFALVTDQVCEAIHQGLMTREEGVKLANKYDGKCDISYLEKVCDYLKISLNEFYEVVDKFVNRELFEKKNGQWSPKFTVGLP